MIRHIVLIRFQPGLGEAEIARLFAPLADLAAKLPGLLHFAAGRSESPEQIERGYLHGFTIDFADGEALQAYAEDPDHKRFGASLVAHAEGGLEGLLVFDLPMA